MTVKNLPPGAGHGRPSDLVAALRRADAEGGLFAPGMRLVVAVSGGPDSIALLDALRHYAPERGLGLHLAHLDHRLRPGSVEDAAWVAQLAAAWGLPATLDARDVGRLAAETGRGTEEAARRARYAFLAAVARRVGAPLVVTAHSADDQAETVLMHFLRGSGLGGLRGMAPLADYPLDAAEIAALEDLPATPSADWPPRLARPFLGVSRAELLAWLVERELAARADPSNADPAFLRNRIRHSILPLLETVNPNLRATLARNAAAIEGDLGFIEAAVDAAWAALVGQVADQLRFDRRAWLSLHPALQRRLLRRAQALLAGRAQELGWEDVEAARAAIARGPGARSLPGGLRLAIGEEAFVLSDARPHLPPPALAGEPVLLDLGGETRLPGGWTVRAELRAARPSDRVAPRDPWEAWLDAEAAGTRPAARARRPGDRFQPLGLGGRHKSLQDLFVDARIPQALREGWPIIVAEGDRILWVPGLRLDERARVRPETRRLLVLRVQAPPAVAGKR